MRAWFAVDRNAAAACALEQQSPVDTTAAPRNIIIPVRLEADAFRFVVVVVIWNRLQLWWKLCFRSKVPVVFKVLPFTSSLLIFHGKDLLALKNSDNDKHVS